MNAFPMIVRCAIHQGPARPSAAATPVKRYRVASDRESSLYRYLRSALAAGKQLVQAGHTSVLIQDLLAAPGQPEQWVWEADAVSGRWRESVRTEQGESS
jgi:hypothetical protein